MPQTRSIHHAFTLNEAPFKLALALAGALALVVALVYFFPSHDDTNSLPPEAAMYQAGP